MIRRSTWILLCFLALAVVAYFFIKNRTFSNSAEATPTGIRDVFLITQADGELQSLFIEDWQNHVVQVQRDVSGTWIVTQPSTGPADQSLVSAAETQVGALRIVTILENPLNLLEVGLDSPAYKIELTFVGGEKHVIQVGMLTPTNSGYYVHYDDGNLYIVSQPGIDAILNLLTAPPFPATATPFIMLDETATPIRETISPTP